MYKADHIKVLKVLASGLPKRKMFRTKDIVGTAFKRSSSGDRRVRNAYRMLIKEGHAEIVERGVYRLTTAGAALCRKLEREDWKLSKAKKGKICKKAKKTTKSSSSSAKINVLGKGIDAGKMLSF